MQFKDGLVLLTGKFEQCLAENYSVLIHNKGVFLL